MKPATASELTREGFEILCLWSRNIAMLPLEDWKAAFVNANTTAPILDPTLYRDFIYSEKAQFLVKLIDAALPLKKLVLEAQPLVLEELKKAKL